jgi:alanine-synthesizing transaminase
MFSARTRWDLTANRLASLADARRAAGRTLIDLTQSNPTQAGLPYPADLLAPLSDPSSLRYEPSPFGLPAARDAVAADYRRRGVDMPAGQIVLTASSSEAYAFLFKLLCDPGDTVLVPRPSYPLFEYLAGLESVAVLPYPLRYDGEWHVDLPALAAAAAAGRSPPMRARR